MMNRLLVCPFEPTGIATDGPGTPREFRTTLSLSQPGGRVVFKVDVVLSTGNEAGSAPMWVQRPFSPAG